MIEKCMICKKRPAIFPPVDGEFKSFFCSKKCIFDFALAHDVEVGICRKHKSWYFEWPEMGLSLKCGLCEDLKVSGAPDDIVGYLGGEVKDD